MSPEPSSPMDYGPTSNGISFASLRMCQGHKLRFKNANHPENRREGSWRRGRRKSKRGQEKGRVKSCEIQLKYVTCTMKTSL